MSPTPDKEAEPGGGSVRGQGWWGRLEAEGTGIQDLLCRPTEVTWDWEPAADHPAGSCAGRKLPRW